MTADLKRKLLPFMLSALLIVVDQITKALIVANVDLHTVGVSLFDGFLRIIHTRNLGIAFSIGVGLPEVLRTILFVALPKAVLAFLVVYYFKTKDLTRFQHWAIAGILGGGLGNIIDRIFRPAGVVDFIDVRFFGIFGWDRWPTFNVADASVVVCGILLVVSTLFQPKPQTELQ